MTSAANPHYQSHFDRLFDLAKAGDWDGVRNYDSARAFSATHRCVSRGVGDYRKILDQPHAPPGGLYSKSQPHGSNRCSTENVELGLSRIINVYL